MSQHDENAVIVKNVYKSFRLPHEQHNGIKQLALNVFKKPSKRKRGYETQHVLKDISFEIKKGEFFGIVGRNGSGKSTLLKLLAGIYTADKGAIAVNGSLTPFIELGVGFNPELTGRENVYLNGALLGFSKEDMESMYDDIVSFAELEKFMDQKLKNYSSGMQVRLAFSIAIRAKSDILLIDEVLAVGDANFQEKCLNYFHKLRKQKQTVILVTHDISTMQRLCTKAMLISDGKLVEYGKPDKIAELYYELNRQVTVRGNKGDKVSKGRNPSSIIKCVKLKDGDHAFKSHEVLTVEIQYDNQEEQPLQFGFQIFTSDGEYCFGTNSSLKGETPTVRKSGTAYIKVNQNLGPGNYYITIAAMNSDATAVREFESAAQHFEIIPTNQVQGIVNLDHTWHIS